MVYIKNNLINFFYLFSENLLERWARSKVREEISNEGKENK
jgi:hypothetical protein